ncbi:MAG: Rpn family recombination-promoting nuclease/putative transposase [Planctomycetes bacterium]|nr:Rpn family recombination-promoting nuclease/putative transposase [Planctomycetota bacterium]
MRVVDSDVSTVATLADKVIEVLTDEPFVLHLEPQAYYDKGLDVRMFEANGRLTKRHGRFVHTCVVLLDRAAWGRANTGRYQCESPLGGCRVDFQYEVIKVWELPVRRLLSAGVGVLLLAPVSDVYRDEAPAVIEQMAQRFRQEVPRAVEAELWTATFVLVGLKYDELFARTLLRGVLEIMKESVTYQAILEEGRAEGHEQGRLAKGREDILRIGTKRFGKPSRKVRETISGISDVDHLNALLDRVLEVSNWKELIDE